MGKRTILIVLLLGLSFPLYADDPLSCANHQYRPEMDSAERLKAIANTCSSPLVSELYRHRARYAQLIQRYEAASSKSDRFITAYRIYITLTEDFAANANNTPVLSLVALNMGYEYATRLTELRLKGEDELAAWLEWNRANMQMEDN